MKFMGILGLITIPYNIAESNVKKQNRNRAKKETFNGVDDCSLRIGERHKSKDIQHRRMVSVNLLPERCEESDTVKVDIPHDKTKKAFKKVRSNPRQKKKGKEHNKNERFGSWYGEDAADGATFNYVQDADGNIHGSLVDISSHSVMQFSVEDGNPIVTITDSSGFQPELDPPQRHNDDNIGEERYLLSDITEESPTIGDLPLTRSSYLRTNNSPSTREKQEEARTLYNDSGANLDIMVVWTEKAECKNYYGYSSRTCTLTQATKLAMEARINLAIEETNTAFELSGVETKLFLAHSYRHPTFVETAVDDSLTALRNGGITTGSQGVSGIKENRERYGADLVAMIIHSTTFCGTAYIGPRIDLMYSVTAWHCATGYYTFGHEIGHNLGLRHDRGSIWACDNHRKYHFGYRDPEARFRTILAGNCKSDQCDSNVGGDCTRIQRFSNPKYDFFGAPVGTPMDNNARKINRVKSTVAQYFPHGGTGGAGGAATMIAPSPLPSYAPSSLPSYASSSLPSYSPSALPSYSPSSLPSASPLLLPSYSPTSSPSLPSWLPSSSSSSQSPTLFPSKSSTSCSDSTLEFFYQDQRVTCATVGSQQSFCSDTDIQAICPATCGTCLNCVDTGLEFEFFHDRKKRSVVRGCDMIANKPTLRCTFYGISDTCRATCGSC